ncbi:hypothetical protein UFOVP1229_167 [uncultured Caudovirales phage]|uniref:Uncharacterized protein n=1 Tax=uncultured Caudovirales phage TaxID=2100421 RepID=A0A6J5R7Q4_9CAUD|nr:hypothetical protein UFOVP1229_167 [uncultured Caudovirales phage]
MTQIVVSKSFTSEFEKWTHETTGAINDRLEALGHPYDLDGLSDCAYWKVMCVAAFEQSNGPKSESVSTATIDAAIREGLECEIREEEADGNPDELRQELKRKMEETQ